MSMSRAERRRAEKLAKKGAKKGGSTQAGGEDLEQAMNALLQDAGEHYRAGRLPLALKTLEKVISADPNRPQVFAQAGMIALDLNKSETALSYYKSARDLGLIDQRIEFGLALAAKAAGDISLAAEAARKAYDLSGGALEPGRVLVDLLWHLDQVDDIPELARNLLKHAPHNTQYAMYEAMAYYHLGAPEKARTSLGFDTLVEIHDLEVPDGFADMAAFNKALADHVADHNTMAVPDESHPTYHNDDLHITRELIGPNATDDGGPVKVLEAMISEKVDDYLSRRLGKMDHPFLDRWPKKNRLTAWGTLLRGRGNLSSHIHLDGYLGMVYYPELPAHMKTDHAGENEDISGYLELGTPPDDFPVKIEADSHLIQPKEGRLVIFPGYFFHRTMPFESSDRRISIAFDVVAD